MQMSNSYREHVENLLAEAQYDLMSQEILRIMLRNEVENGPLENIIKLGHFLLSIKGNKDAKSHTVLSRT